MDRLWKVLIADDEPIIREGIREAVNWPALQMEVVAEAEDGEEALELALQLQVDLLLVDLNMPIMNGITLMKHIREQLPACRLVIITGHDEFAYAQEAIRLGVDEYILKPANPQALMHVLENVRRQMETIEKQNEHLRMASKQIAKNIPLLRERFCLEWIEGNLAEEEIIEQLQFLQLPDACPYQLGVIRWPEIYANQPLLKENDRQLFLFAIENIVSELLVTCQKVMFRDPSGIIIVCLWGELPETALTEIERAIQAYLKIKVDLHFEPIHGGLTEVAEAYRQCKGAVFKELQMSPVVRRARQYIRDHFASREITLELVAQSLQVSPVYLGRIIKQELGMSFVSIITQLRVKKAVQLLNSTELTINEISEIVGYDTQHYFSTAFKKVMGVSPNQYRKGVAFSEDSV